MAVFSSFVPFAIAAGIICCQGSLAAQGLRNPSVFTKSGRAANHTALHPVLNQDADTTNLGNLVPARNVSLNWGTQGNSIVNVSLEMVHPTVLLEEVDDISSVDCEAVSVSIAFNSTNAFNKALANWPRDGNFILVTNHLGDCDTDNERGFYSVQTVTSDKDTLTVVANAEKSDVNNIAAALEITFSAIPVPQSKRAITLDSSGLTISNSFSLPEATSLYTYDPYVSVVADKATLAASITLSGKLSYSIIDAQLHELSFDIDASTSADLGLTVNAKAPYNTTFAYEPSPLTYSIVNVPGIVSLGPALGFAIGADLAVSAAVAVTAGLGVKIAAGNAHLDFLNSSRSSATGWEPTFTATANITEKAVASVDPFAEVTVELEFKLLGGLLDLSGGVTAQPRFNNDFTLTATQALEGTTNGSTGSESATQPSAGGDQCVQGLAIKSEFGFSVIAFVTQWWHDTVYHVTVPVAEECYTWL